MAVLGTFLAQKKTVVGFINTNYLISMKHIGYNWYTKIIEMKSPPCPKKHKFLSLFCSSKERSLITLKSKSAQSLKYFLAYIQFQVAAEPNSFLEKSKQTKNHRYWNLGF